jgi:hypothetical protein
MIELTTTLAFILSSMYGTSGAAVIESVDVQPIISTSTDALITVTTDRKALEKYLRENYADTPILLEIAKCESTITHYDKNGVLIRGRVNKADVGVMQINEKYHLEDSKKLGFDIHTVEGNVGYAKYLYSKMGSSPWSASSPCWGKTLAATNENVVLAKN